MRDTIEVNVTQAQLDSTESWRKEKGVEVTKTKPSSRDERWIVKLWVSAPSDYEIGQFRNKLASAPRQ